jgi:hypothetical protein
LDRRKTKSSRNSSLCYIVLLKGFMLPRITIELVINRFPEQSVDKFIYIWINYLLQSKVCWIDVISFWIIYREEWIKEKM